MVFDKGRSLNIWTVYTFTIIYIYVNIKETLLFNTIHIIGWEGHFLFYTSIYKLYKIKWLLMFCGENVTKLYTNTYQYIYSEFKDF